jgi:hypothetical protein
MRDGWRSAEECQCAKYQGEMMERIQCSYSQTKIEVNNVKTERDRRQRRHAAAAKIDYSKHLARWAFANVGLQLNGLLRLSSLLNSLQQYIAILCTKTNPLEDQGRHSILANIF